MQCPVASIIIESQVRNSKSETRNPRQYQNSKRKKTIRPALQEIAARQTLAGWAPNQCGSFDESPRSSQCAEVSRFGTFADPVAFGLALGILNLFRILSFELFSFRLVCGRSESVGHLFQSRQGRRRVAGRRKPPDQEPTPHTPAPEGRRIRPAGAHEGMGWVPGSGGLSPPAHVRHPAGVRWGLGRRERRDTRPPRKNPSVDPKIHRQAGFAEKNTKDAKSRSAHLRLNPSDLEDSSRE
jgi:hypothetical protein